eukprot:gene6788-7891_t
MRDDNGRFYNPMLPPAPMRVNTPAASNKKPPPIYTKAPQTLLTQNIYYGINYPGNVQNVDRCLETIGGLPAITKVFKHTDDSEFLTLKRRPTYQNCMPAFGDRKPTCHLLLRVRKIKDEEQPETKKELMTVESNDGGAEEAPAFQADIIALVPTSVEFNRMADFQFIFKPNASRSPEDADKYFTNKNILDESLNTLPAMFTRSDRVHPYHFRTNPLATFNEDTKTFSVGIKPNKLVRSIVVRFETDTIPAVSAQNMDQVGNTKSTQAAYDILTALFAERPVWLLVPLRDYFQKRGGLLKYLNPTLPFVAYKFSNGPWRCCAVRLGYDPRKMASASIYQVLNFRMDVPENNMKKAKKTFTKPIRGIAQQKEGGWYGPKMMKKFHMRMKAKFGITMASSSSTSSSGDRMVDNDEMDIGSGGEEDENYSGGDYDEDEEARKRLDLEDIENNDEIETYSLLGDYNDEDQDYDLPNAPDDEQDYDNDDEEDDDEDDEDDELEENLLAASDDE